MTSYSVLVANYPLEEVDFTGITEITVKELKQLYPQNNYDEMDDNAKIIHVPDESAFAELQVFQWENYPLDLDEYNEKPYIYGISGRWESKFLSDLLNYLKESIQKEHGAQLIRFWAGDELLPLKKLHVNLETLDFQLLEKIASYEYVRVIFE